MPSPVLAWFSKGMGLCTPIVCSSVTSFEMDNFNYISQRGGGA